MPTRAAAATLLLAALVAGARAAAQPAHPGDRDRLVQGWRVEDRAEEDGGRLVRMTRTSGPYRLEYRAAFWRGNDGVIRRLSALGDDCGADEALDRHRLYPTREIRARLAAALASCAARPGMVRAVLRGLEPAYALASDWELEAAAKCDTAKDAAERESTESNAPESAEAAAC